MSQSPDPDPPRAFDPLLPPEMAAACERLGAAKAEMPLVRLAVLAGLAGAFIALGAMLYTLTLTGSGLGFGPARLLGGVAFSLGLILVIIGGAELFTGNTLIVMACASRRASLRALLRNWGVAYVGNFAGALLTVLLVYATKQWTFDDHAVGGTALRIAAAKADLAFGQALALGVLCNALVALAVWLALGARDLAGKVLVIVFPITAFVAAGFEHSIANMYFLPMALLLDGKAAAAEASGLSAGALEALTWGRFFWKNLLPVTLGNVIGGALLVGAVYWFVYRWRPARAAS